MQLLNSGTGSTMFCMACLSSGNRPLNVCFAHAVQEAFRLFERLKTQEKMMLHHSQVIRQIGCRCLREAAVYSDYVSDAGHVYMV